MSEQCGKCDGQFDTLAEVFGHECTPRQWQVVPNGFGGTTTKKRTEVQAAAAPKVRTAKFDGAGVDYDLALAKTGDWIRARFADAKLEVADITPKLQWLAEEFARRYNADQPFQFLENMHEARVKWGKLSVGQAKGVLNCIRADALRAAGQAVNAGPVAGLDLRGLPESAHGILRVAVPDHATGGLIFLQICQGRRNGSVVVLQEVGGNEDLFLGQQKVGESYRGRRVAELEAVVADPKTAIVAYGLHFTRCGICSTQLTDAVSIDRGIGPKCLAKAGW